MQQIVALHRYTRARHTATDGTLTVQSVIVALHAAFASATTTVCPKTKPHQQLLSVEVVAGAV